MSLGRCEGYRYVCGDPATWTVEATDERDEWHACENCVEDALRDGVEAPRREVSR